jgi:hypothetical protein
MTGVFAFLLAAATPAADARAAEAALVALHDSVCARQTDPGADFRPVARSDVPADAAGMYIGPSEGRRWRRAGPLPAFVALSRGPGHWGGVEEQCVVAVQGARFEPVTATFARRMRIPWAADLGTLGVDQRHAHRARPDDRDGHAAAGRLGQPVLGRHDDRTDPTAKPLKKEKECRFS